MNTPQWRHFVAMLCLACGWQSALAQTNPQADMDAAIATVEGMFDDVSRFVGDTRFDEGDIESLIEHWDGYAVIGGDDEDDDAAVDFNALLANDEYRQWTASHDLDAEDWLRKTVRITMILYREQMLEEAEEIPQQVDAQLAEIDAQRAQLGEEMYEQLRASVEMGQRYALDMLDAARKLPEPTAEESRALDAYRDELMSLMYAEEDYEGYDEDYFYEDDYEEDGEFDEDDS